MEKKNGGYHGSGVQQGPVKQGTRHRNHADPVSPGAMPPDLSLILPCYNEASFFTDSVGRIRDVLDSMRYSYEIILVDDASRDGTADMIRRVIQSEKIKGKSEKWGSMRAIYHTRNQGRGKAAADGILAARGKVVGYMDIDCEVSPVYIPHMVSQILRGNADVVIGKRHYRTSAGSLLREALSRGYQAVSAALIGTGGLDTESGYKFFNRKKILPILRHAANPGWFWDTEIMVYARRAGLRIMEVPVLFIRRFDKRSSVNIVRDTVGYIVQLWRFRKVLNTKNQI